MGLLARLRRLFGGRSGVPHISTEELRDANPRPVLVEALNANAYSKGHLPGAINIPRAKVQELAPTLIPDLGAAIVTYCKSPT
ncbi:MAG TPA: rhodanese-like domain-containing protein [Myxococcales bacterium]|nr:rhodanese-like domain-containing protein [Myxococcales bacterium]